MKKAISLVLFSIFIWSFSSVIIYETSRISAWHVYTLAYFFAAIIFYFFSKEKLTDTLIRTIGKLPRKYFFLGLFGYFFYSFSYIQTMQAFGTASEPTVLNYTWILFTVLFTMPFRYYATGEKQRLSFRSIIGLLIGFASIWILATKGGVLGFQFQNIEGIFWGIAAGASYGFFSGFAGTVPEKDNNIFLCIAVGLSAILMFILAMLNDPSGFSKIGLKELLLILAIGGGINGLAYWCWTRANIIAYKQNFEIAKIASLVFVLPLSNVVMVSLYLNEVQIWEPYFLASLVLIVLSVVIIQKD